MRDDVFWMRRALRLANRAFSTPNPMVGCVLVKSGAIVGEGWTQPIGQAHAEVMALRMAGEQARGATAYVTLEPCAHFGRTPPCADALAAAGIARVVAATVDSDTRVSGRGLEKLRQAGIEVTVGLLEQEARESNRAFFHFQATRTPLVTLKTAMTLDGKIATVTGSSQWITGAKARHYVHHLRAQSGAVLMGIGTLLADDARMDARLSDGEFPRQPLRIVVDSHLRTPPTCKAVQLAGENPERFPLLIAATETAPLEREAALRLPGVEIVRFPVTAEGYVPLPALCALLAERKIISVLVEGGAGINAAFLEARLAHQALIFIAPKFVGGSTAPGPIGGHGVPLMADALEVREVRLRRFGPDIALEGTIRYA